MQPGELSGPPPYPCPVARISGCRLANSARWHEKWVRHVSVYVHGEAGLGYPKAGLSLLHGDKYSSLSLGVGEPRVRPTLSVASGHSVNDETVLHCQELREEKAPLGTPQRTAESVMWHSSLPLCSEAPTKRLPFEAHSCTFPRAHTRRGCSPRHLPGCSSAAAEGTGQCCCFPPLINED